MHFTLISDTHGFHDRLQLKGGETLIHAGDVSKTGTMDEVVDFLKWFSQQDYKHKIFIAGNHDFFFEDCEQELLEFIIPENVTYLNDSGIIIDGIKIWGSPVQPRFFDWAFNRDRGEDIQKHWDLIPKDSEVLITHGPPYGILDLTTNNLNVGCEALLSTMDRLNIKLHVFGHIHEAHGEQQLKGTQFVNASVLDEKYNLCFDPVRYLWP